MSCAREEVRVTALRASGLILFSGIIFAFFYFTSQNRVVEDESQMAAMQRKESDATTTTILSSTRAMTTTEMTSTICPEVKCPQQVSTACPEVECPQQQCSDCKCPPPTVCPNVICPPRKFCPQRKCATCPKCSVGRKPRKVDLFSFPVCHRSLETIFRGSRIVTKFVAYMKKIGWYDDLCVELSRGSWRHTITEMNRKKESCVHDIHTCGPTCLNYDFGLND